MLIIFHGMITYMLRNKKLKVQATELFISGKN